KPSPSYRGRRPRSPRGRGREFAPGPGRGRIARPHVSSVVTAMRIPRRLKIAGLLVGSLALAGGVAAYLLFSGMGVPEAHDLRAFVKSHPPVPVVFTSRTEPIAFEAAAPEGEGFTYPGTIPWGVALPPMRYAADGSLLSPEDRRRTDYDDVDPTDRGVALWFASSRLPDLGLDHTRRATQIWAWPKGEPEPRPMSANRNNDR